MTTDIFKTQIERLRALRFPPADFNAHWEALRDIPDELFSAAVSLAQRTRAEFPTPAELRLDADAVTRHQVRSHAVHPTSRMVPIAGGFPVRVKNPFGGKDLNLVVTEALRHDCDDCDDTGRVAFWCGDEPSTRWPWMYVRKCGPDVHHRDHDWSAPCPCLETNPTIQRRKAAQAAKYSQEPEKVNR